MTTYPTSTNDAVSSTDKKTSTLWAGKLYLDFPLWNGNFAVGTQDSYTHTTLDYCMLNTSVSEYIPSSSTNAKAMITEESLLTSYTTFSHARANTKATLLQKLK